MTMQVCAAWATPDRMCNEGDGTTDDCVDGTVPLVYKFSDEELLLAASNILYSRTGFKWAGVCAYAVWPCIDNCTSDQHACATCVRYDAVQLPSQRVVEITEVNEGGVTLDPSDYRLEVSTVVRLDGKRWQRNTFGLPGATTGIETVITYTAGEAPPIEGVIAAAALADEMKEACNGTCKPDSKLASYSRRGVSVELVDLEELMKTGATGIPAVDRFIAAWGERRSMRFADPAQPVRGLPVV